MPNKLCTKTHCQYDFYQTKDPNKKIKDNSNPDGSTTAVDDSTSEDEDDLDARIGNDEASSVVKAPKRKKKLFQTKVVDEKTHNPAWNFKAQHLVQIDDDMLIKLQSDSITVAVYGMQDGREKFLKIKTGTNRQQSLKTIEGITQIIGDDHEHNTHECDSEMEKLRKENARL